VKHLAWIASGTSTGLFVMYNAPSVIRTKKASWDMRCPEKQIRVVELERVHIKYNVWTGPREADRSIYRAHGCGTSAIMCAKAEQLRAGASMRT